MAEVQAGQCESASLSLELVCVGLSALEEIDSTI